MSMQDPIGDMLSRVRNGQMAGLEEVSMPSSKMKCAIAAVLKDEGYVESFSVTDKVKPVMTVKLKYYNGKPVIEKIKRISTPGLRRYVAADSLPVVSDGLGITIVSTSKGVVTGHAASAAGIGGEVICTVF